MIAEKLGEFEAIVRHALNRHRLSNGRSGLLQCLACAALVPLHDDEVLFPRREQFGLAQPGRARPAVQAKQHGAPAIPPAYLNPLVDSAYLEAAALVDSVRSINGEALRIDGAGDTLCS